MKKICILISALALSGCAVDSVRDYSPQERAVLSNRKITNMVTYLETDGSGNTIHSRSGTDNRHTAGAYDLDDVDFIIADEGFDGKIRFHLKEGGHGQIDGLTVLGDEGEDDMFFARSGESNAFTGMINIETEEDDENGGRYRDGDEGEEIDGSVTVPGKLIYTSVAKRSNLGLRYSDFGNIMVKAYIDGAYRDQQTFVFIGGYDDAKRIDDSTITTSKTFNGKATGGVVAIREGRGSGKSLNLNGDTILTFTPSTGEGQPTTTLAANFTNWYDIQYVQDADGNKSIHFNNYVDTTTDAAGNNVAPGTFRMVSDTYDEENGIYASDIDSDSDGNTDGITIANTQYQEYEDGQPAVDGNSQPVIADTINSEIRYYGDGNSPSEVVGIVQIRDHAIDPNNDQDNALDDFGNINDYGTSSDPHEEVRMNISFGGVAH